MNARKIKIIFGEYVGAYGMWYLGSGCINVVVGQATVFLNEDTAGDWIEI